MHRRSIQLSLLLTLTCASCASLASGCCRNGEDFVVCRAEVEYKGVRAEKKHDAFLGRDADREETLAAARRDDLARRLACAEVCHQLPDPEGACPADCVSANASSPMSCEIEFIELDSGFFPYNPQ